MLHGKWVIAAGLFAAVIIFPAAHAQNSTSSDNMIKRVIDLQKQLLQASEENIRALSTFQFNLQQGAICIDDIDNINDDVSDHISRIVALYVSLSIKDESIKTFILSNLKDQLDSLLGDLALKRKRLNIDATRICGSVPLIVTRARVTESLLEEIERSISTLSKRY